MTEQPPRSEDSDTTKVCPSCGSTLTLDHTDDVGTKFFKCEKCGQTKKDLSLTVDLPQQRTEDKKPAPHIQRVKSLDNPEAKLSQADKLVLLCEQRQPVLFCDQTGAAYARVEWRGVYMTMHLRSQAFKAWLANLLWLSEQKAPGTQAVYSAINVLTAMANSGPKYALFNRVAPSENCFWIDMCDEKWRAIKVSANGWEIVENPPTIFKRYDHQLPLEEPKHGGDPWKLLVFLNIAPDDKDSQLLLPCLSISYMIPKIPHPILGVHGHQGSAKSWLFRIIGSLIDPSKTPLLRIPWDDRERIQQLDHHWCVFYDNISGFSREMSDDLCRAASGGGFTKRALYSDDDDVIYDFLRCVGFNGINIAAQRGDLLDRCLLISVKDIPNDKRKTEQQLDSEFEACRSEILGGLLDTLVKAMQLYPSVNPKGLFRMADFTRWGCAIAKALGKTEQAFIDAYGNKVNTQIEEAVHASPVATVLLDLLETWKNWEGTPTKLFTDMLDHATKLKISTRQKSWPKAPHVLMRQLNDLAPSLKALGWEIIESKSGATRRIVISSVPSDPNKQKDGKGKEKRDGRDAWDASTLTSILWQVKNYVRTERDDQGQINLNDLADFVQKELNQDPQAVIQKAFDESIIAPSPKPGMAVVI
jgi:DNA-directed RNA polymerase subunit M/transcription elongation factor TFIIS